jgi:hypothetical protein
MVRLLSHVIAQLTAHALTHPFPSPLPPSAPSA